MGKQVWTFISYLFHPALMPTLAVFAVLWCDPNLSGLFFNEKSLLIVIAVVLSSTYILPLAVNYILLLFGKISSLSNPTRTDRLFMLSYAAPFFILGYYAFHNIPSIGESLKVYMLGLNISLLITLFTSMLTKVSFHSVGAGGLLGTVIGLMKYTQEYLFMWLLAAFIIVILTALSRYKLKAHEAFDIYLGLIIGITVQSLVLFLGLHQMVL